MLQKIVDTCIHIACRQLLNKIFRTPFCIPTRVNTYRQVCYNLLIDSKLQSDLAYSRVLTYYSDIEKSISASNSEFTTTMVYGLLA